MGAVLGQREDKQPIVICYVNRALDEAKQNYNATKKELLGIMYVMEKFRPYLLCSKVIVYTDHSSLKHLLENKDVKSHLIWWLLLLQKSNLEIMHKVGAKNVVADHLSRLIVESIDIPLSDTFPGEHLLNISTGQAPWFADFINYLDSRIFPYDLSSHYEKKFFYDFKLYFREESFLLLICPRFQLCLGISKRQAWGRS